LTEKKIAKERDHHLNKRKTRVRKGDQRDGKLSESTENEIINVWNLESKRDRERAGNRHTLTGDPTSDVKEENSGGKIGKHR